MMDANLAKVLGEVLLLHRWAGGESVPLARLYGLAHGVESVLRQEKAKTISEETQEKIEDILQEVERNQLSPDGMTIEDRLRQDEIDEIDAKIIMRLCVLQSRFGEGVEKIANSEGSAFSNVLDDRSKTVDWYGALHLIELIDESGNTKPLTVSTPFIPRIGEVVETHKGTPMIVTDVSYFVMPVKDALEGKYPQRILFPTVMMRPVEDESETPEK